MNRYCIILDSRYVAYSYCLYQSLHRHVKNPVVSFYCVDDYTPVVLARVGIPLNEIIKRQMFIPTEVIAVENEYARNEFCWRCKPLAVAHALTKAGADEWAFYLDSDMLVFANIEKCLDLETVSSVRVTPHRFSSPKFEKYEQLTGSFNAGFVGFRKDTQGMDALKWWDVRCAESCSATPKTGTYADQKYLETMHDRFDCVESISHVGLNAAPWNIERYEVTNNDDGSVLLDKSTLFLYHFQGMEFIYSNACEAYTGELNISRSVRKYIYTPYLREISLSYERLRKAVPNYHGNLPHGLLRGKKIYYSIRRLVRGRSNFMYVSRRGSKKTNLPE